MHKRLLVLALASLPAFALAMPGSGEHATGHGGHGKHGGMFHQLDLTAEQKHDVHQLMRQQHQQQREIVQRYLDKLPEADKLAMTKEQQATRDANREAMRELLSADQQKRFDTLVEERAARQQERAEFQKWKAERDTQQ